MKRLCEAILNDRARAINEDGGAGGVGAMGGGGGTNNASTVANAPREEPLKKGPKGMVRRGAIMRFER